MCRDLFPNLFKDVLAKRIPVKLVTNITQSARTHERTLEVIKQMPILCNQFARENSFSKILGIIIKQFYSHRVSKYEL